ncbi:venom carboxylesterase-6-like [Schistocerca gregaria]|uniref:venom carboxylesterase-6-like n=1 Tax=Schistocerca gregaria TaxID=7010 RepID=UPI00211DBC40|nr:venom carboxylesterase-6-like [Schistocerca gregaria]
MSARLAWFLFSVVASAVVAQDVLVTVEQGVLKGSVVTSKLGTPYAAFRGVPYATPPLGELRFQAPQPAASWSGVRDALEEGPACTQVPLPDVPTARDPGDEDCLVLNLYVPLNTTEPPPVYVWMPGGAYYVGSGTVAQYGPDLLIEEGIAAVTVNYRLGALGFLSTEDEVIPGNAGLKDQVMALRWLQQNVAAFGADPQKVTVGGESAGGSSAAHHLISPSSAGLFRSVTIESGESVSPYGVTSVAREKAFRLGEVLGFSTNDSRELLDFLRTQDAHELVAHDADVQTEAERLSMNPMVFLPVVEPNLEGAFMTDRPANNLRAGRFNKVPVLEGATSGEGTVLLGPPLEPAYLEDAALLQQLSDHFVEAVSTLVHRPTAAEREQAALQLRDFYFGHENITLDDAQALVDMTSDIFFVEPADSAVRIIANHSDAGPLYYYQFDYRGPELGNSTYGTPHAADAELLWLRPDESPPDANTTFGLMRSNLVRLWSNFIKYGTPSPEGEPIVWTPFNNADLNYLHITDTFTMEQNVNQERMDFWHQNIPVY